ncbi:DUF5655 domain-containing protein [Glutamicibacter sp. NPDC087344]|uniref:DUF5655 domain-containing protein n=1 Tax=Glutamicibacter sp. NPDC087344 TaxID=3363994 RepID=UPI0037F860F4
MTAEDEWTIERHLAGQPQFAIDIFHRFIEAVAQIGPFTYAVSKSSITLKGTHRGFAGARPVRGGLRGYFDLQREVVDPRISSASAFSQKLIVHHFQLATADQLDEQFRGWLREAYAVGAGAHRN